MLGDCTVQHCGASSPLQRSQGAPAERAWAVVERGQSRVDARAGGRGDVHGPAPGRALPQRAHTLGARVGPARAQVVVDMFLGLRLGAHFPSARIP